MNDGATARLLLLPPYDVDPDRQVAELQEQLYAALQSYSASREFDSVDRAFRFANVAHQGVVRRSGEPYIMHPLMVATMLAQMQLDAPTICAALLHDVVEDTKVTLDELRERFGETVARLVDGVTKFTVVEKGQRDREQLALAKAERDESDRRRRQERERSRRAQVETLRKLFITMAEDPRVVLIKLADRLHNMETITALTPAAQQRMAEETMDVYAPLAGRLGVFSMKSRLEDLAFAVLEPEQFAWIQEQVGDGRSERLQSAQRVAAAIDSHLKEQGLEAVITARAKHLWSVYNKVRSHDGDISQVNDLIAVRVIVPTKPDCYAVLGVVHSLWKPMPNRFKDYIALPKINGYQSLHTTVFGDEGRPTEIQIRTTEMHRVAEYGVATHWYYKERGGSVLLPMQMIRWARQLMEWQKELTNAQDLVEAVSTDIFQDQVYVFTPEGDIKDLPAGSTPVDFAYRVHTEVGHHCIGARVNGKLVTLDSQLQNGDVVEILTTKSDRGPSRDWLNFVKSSSAQQRIRQWFKRLERQDNITRGREILDRELKKLASRSLDAVGTDKLRDVAQQMHFDELDDLLAAIGFGEASPQSVISRLGLRAEEAPLPTKVPISVSEFTGAGMRVMGVGDMFTRLAPCCNPIPGDAIVGFITRGRGVTVHRQDCPNVVREDEPERIVPVSWGKVDNASYPVTIRIEAADREGLLRDVATVVANDGINLSAANVSTTPGNTAIISATLDRRSIDHLSQVQGKSERVRDVISVARIGIGS